ncbi:MAG: hypothetical protein HY556_05000 [Euryarchaeota archaeon]|nr:hypothetical protein [Euryarchaeota archaeon]
MPQGPTVTVEKVRGLARSARVTRDPNYHAHQHFVKFETILDVLAWCFRVEKDKRPEHANGFVSWGRLASGATYRVDFNIGTDAKGETILVVTAMEVTK